MGLELESLADGSTLAFSSVYWVRLLELALAHGWEPQGAIATVDGAVRIPLVYKEGPATVPQTEAWAMAAALSRALPDLPDEDAGGKVLFVSEKPLSAEQVDRLVERMRAQGMKVTAADLHIGSRDAIDWAAHGMEPPQPGAVMPNVLLSPADVYSGDDKAVVRTFILFCQKGTFRIS